MMKKRTRFNYYRKYVKDITIKQVAEHMGCSESLISKYDRGLVDMKDVSYKTLQKFAALFGCAIDDLFDTDVVH